EQSENYAEDHGVNIEGDSRCDHPRSGIQPANQKKAEHNQKSSWQQKEPVGRVKQHESHMTPAVTKAAEVRRAAALVGPQGDRDFRNFRAKLSGLDHEFGGEFHAGASQVHAVVDFAREAAHAAVAVSDAC